MTSEAQASVSRSRERPQETTLYSWLEHIKNRLKNEGVIQIGEKKYNALLIAEIVLFLRERENNGSEERRRDALVQCGVDGDDEEMQSLLQSFLARDTFDLDHEVGRMLFGMLDPEYETLRVMDVTRFQEKYGKQGIVAIDPALSEKEQRKMLLINERLFELGVQGERARQREDMFARSREVIALEEERNRRALKRVIQEVTGSKTNDVKPLLPPSLVE